MKTPQIKKKKGEENVTLWLFQFVLWLFNFKCCVVHYYKQVLIWSWLLISLFL